MQLTIEITGATILVGRGQDTVYLATNLPCPFTDGVEDPLGFMFHTTHKYGKQYVEQTFPDLPIDIVEYAD